MVSWVFSLRGLLSGGSPLGPRGGARTMPARKGTAHAQLAGRAFALGFASWLLGWLLGLFCFTLLILVYLALFGFD